MSSISAFGAGSRQPRAAVGTLQRPVFCAGIIAAQRPLDTRGLAMKIAKVDILLRLTPGVCDGSLKFLITCQSDGLHICTVCRSHDLPFDGQA
jgi:hypothetical protein